MIPSAERFAAKMEERGIGNGDRVIVYDAVGLSSAGRAWWLLRLFGHDNVALLDGGLPKWRAEGRPLETIAPLIPPRRFTARFDPRLVRAKEAIRANIASNREQVVDARSAGRFDGTAEETWPGRRRGHIPGSRNVPFDRVTDPHTRQLKSAEELQALIRLSDTTLVEDVDLCELEDVPRRPSSSRCALRVRYGQWRQSIQRHAGRQQSRRSRISCKASARMRPTNGRSMSWVWASRSQRGKSAI